MGGGWRAGTRTPARRLWLACRGSSLLLRLSAAPSPHALRAGARSPPGRGTPVARPARRYKRRTRRRLDRSRGARRANGRRTAPTFPRRRLSGRGRSWLLAQVSSQRIAEQDHELGDSQLIEISHRILNPGAKLWLDVARGKSVELGGDRVPGHRPRVEALVLVLLTLQRAPVSQQEGYTGAVLGREARRELSTGTHRNATQELLDVIRGDALCQILL